MPSVQACMHVACQFQSLMSGPLMLADARDPVRSVEPGHADCAARRSSGYPCSPKAPGTSHASGLRLRAPAKRHFMCILSMNQVSDIFCCSTVRVQPGDVLSSQAMCCPARLPLCCPCRLCVSSKTLFSEAVGKCDGIRSNGAPLCRRFCSNCELRCPPLLLCWGHSRARPRGPVLRSHQRTPRHMLGS